MSDTIAYNRSIKYISTDYDVVVCGSGPSGIAAAIAAKRGGAKTLLVEAQGQLGGMGTSALVSHWLGGRSNDGEQWIVSGIYRELCEKATAQGVAKIPQPPKGDNLSPVGWISGQLAVGITFDPYNMSTFLEKFIIDEGVDVLLYTNFVDSIVDGEKISSIIVHNKSGLQAISGKLFIDATGDADLAARSGCEFKKGRDGDELSAPATVGMHVEGIDVKILSDYIHKTRSTRFREEIKEWKALDDWPFDYDIFISVQLDHEDVFMINTSRVCGVDGTDGESITKGTMTGHKENLLLFEIMKKRMPGCKNARIKSMGSLIGIRESRRIVGDYVLSVQDLIEGKDFDDVIGFSAYGWDMPDPKRPSYQPMHEKAVKTSKPYTSIPFRIMHPTSVNNLLCPGRAVSVEREVLGPIRVTAPCMAMGQAAGAAAAISFDKGDFTQLDISHLKEVLRQAGVNLDEDKVL